MRGDVEFNYLNHVVSITDCGYISVSIVHKDFFNTDKHFDNMFGNSPFAAGESFANEQEAIGWAVEQIQGEEEYDSDGNSVPIVLVNRNINTKKTNKRGADGRHREWSIRVRQRDGDKCIKCGSTEDIHAHHIKEWSKYPAERYNISNGISLCKKCHIYEHRIRNAERYLLNSDEEVIAVDTLIYDMSKGEYAVK